MRILFLLTQSLDYPSGLGRFGPLARELARLGHQVRVAALHPALRSLSERAFDSAGVTVRYAGPMHVRQVGNERRYYGPPGLAWTVARGTWGLAGQALLAPADIIHVCKPHPMNGLAALLARWLRGRSFYLDCDDDEQASNRFGSAWQQKLVAFWENRLPPRARAVTTNTRATQRRLEALGVPPDRIVYVPNGIERERFSRLDPAHALALRAELGLGESPVVLYLGSLSTTSHPVDLLLDAFARLAPARPQARLLVVGGGEDYAAVRRRLETTGLAASTVMTGRVAPDRVVDYYLAADVVVDPVYDDAAARARSPLKLFEAMACGRPVVTGDVGDRREHLGDGRAGLLVPAGSTDALAAGLVALLDDPERRQAMGRAGQELAGRYYWDVQVHDFARVYER